MWRGRGVWRRETIWLLLAAAAGYLIGNWNAAAPPSGEVRAEGAPAVALRFQADFADPAAGEATMPAQLPRMALASVELGLFNAGVPDAVVPPSQRPLPTRPAAAESPLPTVAPSQADPPAAHLPDRPIAAIKPRPAAPRRLFDDVALARINRRLHLTAAQEPMWPAVAQALRNIGREQQRLPQRRGPLAIAPDSPAVQDLRSAAIPLLMSFSDAQKDEVRHLARTMGLDQLASEF